MKKNFGRNLLPFAFLFCILLLVSCGSEREKIEKEKIPDTTLLSKKKAEEVVFNSDTVTTVERKLCNCVSVNDPLSYNSDLSYSVSVTGKEKAEQDSLLKKYASGNERLKIKSIAIRLLGDGKIPDELKIFKNTEKIFVLGGNSFSEPGKLRGLDIFPKLRSLYFEGASVNFDENEKWLSKIEIFHAGKSSFKGITSFKCMPSLKVFSIGFSTFNGFPKDIHSLKCLQQLELVYYLRGGVKLNVDSLDLSQFPCLKKLHLDCAGKGCFPQGLDTNRCIDVFLNKYELTKEQLQKYQTYKKRKKCS